MGKNNDVYTRKAIDLLQQIQDSKSLKDCQRKAAVAEEYIRLEFYSRPESEE